MSGKTDKDVPGSDAEGPGQGGETPAARHAAARMANTTAALSPVQECRSDSTNEPFSLLEMSKIGWVGKCILFQS